MAPPVPAWLPPPPGTPGHDAVAAHPTGRSERIAAPPWHAAAPARPPVAPLPPPPPPRPPGPPRSRPLPSP
eukprot:scaffold36549_cov202-Isochrysis_galbana.AAC.1